ncbi:MAG TPA: ketol-acid reductoisomerase [Caulobacteraceae bacterium]|jgi:ketol-acid reductoisomerase|nr:ketol-acid reductoisomerase [Caulobacteraceae bacterium]
MAPTLSAPLPVFYDRDLDPALIRARKVCVVGYGSQGRAQALNLKDSGVAQMRIGLREGSKSADAARAEGFEVVTVEEGAAWCDVLALLTSDEAHRDLYRDRIGPHLKDGAALVFAHGLSIRFGLVEPKPTLDVVLCGPKGIGPRIRELYQAGEGVYGLLGVHQDSTGDAKAIALSFLSALGCGRKGILETTFRDECESDLFAEQVVLCGGVPELVRQSIMTLVDAGYPPEVAWFESFYELKLVTDLMFEKGVAGAFEKISNTAEYGAYLTGPQVIGEASRAAMQEVLKAVQDGSFVRRFMADYDAGFKDLKARRAALAGHPMEDVDRRLRVIADKA